MIRRPPRSTLMRSSAASDVYKRQLHLHIFSQSAARHSAPGTPKPHRSRLGSPACHFRCSSQATHQRSTCNICAACCQTLPQSDPISTYLVHVQVNCNSVINPLRAHTHTPSTKSIRSSPRTLGLRATLGESDWALGIPSPTTISMTQKRKILCFCNLENISGTLHLVFIHFPLGSCLSPRGP